MTKKTGKKVAKSKPKAVAVVQSKTPADLLHMAVQQGADIDKMKQLMEMHERWEANEARKAFTVSMAAFRADPPVIFKDQLVSYKTEKGMTEYYHPSLAKMAAAIGESMSPHGLSFRWGTAQDMQSGGMITVTCTLTHIMGHSESVSLSATPDESGGKNKIQAVGSTVKYLERYTLEAITGVASQDMDDDGQAASGKKYATQYQNVPAEYPADQFEKNLPAWANAIAAGKKTPQGIVDMVSNKYTLTDEQKNKIKQIKSEAEQ